MNFKVTFFEVNNRDRCPMINIETPTVETKSSFAYANMRGMYENGQGHAIQVNNPKLEKPLLEMCDKISQAVYDYKKAIKQ